MGELELGMGDDGVCGLGACRAVQCMVASWQRLVLRGEVDGCLCTCMGLADLEG